MRLFLTLLLCVALPWQVWAAQSSVVVLCPMGNMEMAASMEPDADTNLGAEADSSDSCCNDLAAFLQTGQHCKSGPDCTTGTVMFLAQEPARAEVPGTSTTLLSPTAPPWPGRSAGIWRPPTPSL